MAAAAGTSSSRCAGTCARSPSFATSRALRPRTVSRAWARICTAATGRMPCAHPAGHNPLGRRSGEMIKDFGKTEKDAPGGKEGERWLFLKGGKGGWGNTHFKTSVNQAPRTVSAGAAGSDGAAAHRAAAHRRHRLRGLSPTRESPPSSTTSRTRGPRSRPIPSPPRYPTSACSRCTSGT
jgi:hypothetical protein